MFHMLTCFKLKSADDLAGFQDDLQTYGAHLRDRDLLVEIGPIGERQSNTILDTDDRDHTHFMIMTFKDRAQSDAAVKYIFSGEDPADTLHRAVYKNIVDPVFMCWQDC